MGCSSFVIHFATILSFSKLRNLEGFRNATCAEAIGRTLADSGLAVDVRAMKELTDISPYRAIVAGSAIQAGKWLPEAMGFVQAYQSVLTQKPFAAFLVCMTLGMPNAAQYQAFVADFLKPVRSIVKPVSEGLFAGTLDISKVPSFADRLKFRLSVIFGVWSEGDHRDWEAIREWANSIRPLLIP